jgi:tRNA-splicing ligase RtcB
MIKVISDTKTPIKIWASDLEPEAEQQVRNLSGLPFIHSHVAVMPDAHAGKGSTVGTVIATKGAIIPAAVGVDIGCGMCAVKLPFKINVLGGDEFLKQLRHSIERAVPVGTYTNNTITDNVAKQFLALGDVSETAKSKMRTGILDKAVKSIGTLGGGNHFIEICKDEENNAWIMLHSGSRNIGKCLAEIHIDKAKDLMKQYFISLPDDDLAYLVQNTHEFKEYHDLNWAQNFAMANRNEMMDRVLEQVYRHVYTSSSLYDWSYQLRTDLMDKRLFRINCHHNYTSLEHHQGKNVYVTRKGAVSACEGEFGIIPGSMGTGSFIVQGLGNSDSFCSCSHGAGRKMSRTKARKTFTVKDLEEQTSGVECRKDSEVLDEIPGSYKDINEVMNNQSDLVKPIYTLKQLICIKG